MTILHKCAVTLGLAMSSLSAATINFDAASSVVPAGAGYSFSSAGSSIAGSVVTATKNGVSFVGVSRGPAGTELDYGQQLLLSFNQSHTISSLSFGLLFNGPEYGDVQESAIATTSAGTYRLKIVGEGQATWSVWNAGNWNWLQTLLTPASNTQVGGAGLFTVNNPFQGAAISAVTLTSGELASDYGLVRFAASTPQVPETGATVTLLGAALLLVAAFVRRPRVL